MNSKILFVLGSYEYLESLEGKIRKCLFFYVKILQNNSVAWSINDLAAFKLAKLFQSSSDSSSSSLTFAISTFLADLQLGIHMLRIYRF